MEPTVSTSARAACSFTALLATVALVFVALAVPATRADAAPKSQATAKLLTNATVRAFPGASAERVATVKARRPLTGQPTVLPVIGRASADGRPWLRVRLPKRPNGQTGWIAADGTDQAKTPWRVLVDRSARRATIYRSGKVIRRFRVVVGKRATPTPLGEFFIAERVRQPNGTDTGPWALALSAYSNVLQEFAGGPGQVALHGRTGLSNPLGSAASNGCIRFADSAISWMAKRMGAGVPVSIRA